MPFNAYIVSSLSPLCDVAHWSYDEGRWSSAELCTWSLRHTLVQADGIAQTVYCIQFSTLFFFVVASLEVSHVVEGLDLDARRNLQSLWMTRQQSSAPEQLT